MIAAWLALACAQPTLPQADITRLRTILPNQLTVLVENMPSQTVAVQVWIAGVSPRETRLTHGYRHLLEHIMARADGGKWDRLIESTGGVMDAETARDGMVFRVQVPSEQLPLALDCLAAVVKQRTVNPAAVAREARSIYHEAALRPASALKITEVWQRQYADAGLDPFGNPDLLANAVPKQLEQMWAKLLNTRQMAVTVVGPVDLDTTTAQIKRRFSFLEALPVPSEPNQTVSMGAGKQPGSWWMTVDSVAEPRTAAGIAAGLAMASQLSDSYFSYVPLSGPSVVLVGGEEPSIKVADLDADSLYELGQQLALAWINRQLSDPVATAAFRGRLLAQGASLKPETLRENIQAMQPSQFRAAFNRLKGSQP